MIMIYLTIHSFKNNIDNHNDNNHDYNNENNNSNNNNNKNNNNDSDDNNSHHDYDDIEQILKEYLTISSSCRLVNSSLRVNTKSAGSSLYCCCRI